MRFLIRTPGISAREAAALLENGDALALDVRRADEWNAGHIPQAKHVPMSEIGRRLAVIPRERRIIAVCRSGNRSGRVTAALRSQGYQIENLEGGMKAWKQAGLPLEPPDGRVA